MAMVMKMKRKFNFFRLAKKSDGYISFATIALALLGLVMSISASMTSSDNSNTVLIMTTIKEIIFFTSSYFIMVFISKKFSFKKIKKLILPISIAMIFALLFTLFFDEVNGSQAWIRLSLGFTSITIQPSEFAKVFAILLVAVFVGDVSINTKRSGWEILKKVVIVIGIQSLIILLFQDDLGSAIVLMAISFMVLLVPSHYKIRIYQNLAMLCAVVFFGFLIYLLTDKGLAFLEKGNILKGYQLARFTDYANPFLNISGSGYQLAGSLVAFSRGSLMGVGLGQSVQKFGYLPEAKTDFILSLIAEELGFVGVMAVMLLYGLLIYRLIYWAFKVVKEKEKIVLIGTVAYLFVHLLFNVGGITAVIPLTGVPLLLLSSGGSSTMAAMMAIGLSQNIISKNRRKRGKK